MKYQSISIDDVKRMVIVLKYDKYININKNKIEKLAQYLSDQLKTKILDSLFEEFPPPKSNPNLKNYTYIGVLATSDIQISTYQVEKGTSGIDITVNWCSNVIPKNLDDILFSVAEIIGIDKESLREGLVDIRDVYNRRIKKYFFKRE